MSQQFQYLESVEPVQTIARTGLLSPPAPMMETPPRAASLPTALLVAACFLVPTPPAAAPIPWTTTLATPVRLQARIAESVTVQPPNLIAVSAPIPWTTELVIPPPTFRPLTHEFTVKPPATIAAAGLSAALFPPLSTPTLRPYPTALYPLHSAVAPMPTVTPAADLIHRIAVEEHFPWQRMVIRMENTPPAVPSEGQRYIVGTAPTGVWASKANQIAWYYHNPPGWMFDIPTHGWLAYNLSDSLLYVFNGTWEPFEAANTAYAPMTDGAEPPTLISNGAGQIVMVPYTP